MRMLLAALALAAASPLCALAEEARPPDRPATALAAELPDGKPAEEAAAAPRCVGQVFMTDSGSACKGADGKTIFLAGLSREERNAAMRAGGNDVDENFRTVSLTDAQRAELFRKCGRDIACLNRETKRLEGHEGESAFDRDKRERAEAARRRLQAGGVNLGAAVPEATGRPAVNPPTPLDVKKTCRDIESRIRGGTHPNGADALFWANNCAS